MQQEINLLSDEDGMTGVSFDGVSTSPTNRIGSITEDTALSVSEKIDYLEHSIKRTQASIEKINKALEGLSSTELNLVKAKYFEGKQWWRVTYYVGYSERHCRRIRREAIQKMAIAIHGDKVIDKGLE